MTRTGFRRWRRTGLDLTVRQEQVIRLIERGFTNGEIATELGITLDGVKFHVSEILAKLEVGSREEAVQAWRSRRVPPWSSFGLPMLKVGGIVAAGAVGVVAIAGMVIALRSGGSDSETALPLPTSTTSPTASPTATAVAPVGHEGLVEVGIEEVDRVVAAALSGDPQALFDQIATRMVACQMLPSGPIPAPPMCPSGVAEGTLVPTVTVLGGEASRLVVDGSDSAFLEMLETWLREDRQVFAIKELAVDAGWDANYAIIFATPIGAECPGCIAGNALLLASDGITVMLFDPVNSTANTDEGLRGTYILPPP